MSDQGDDLEALRLLANRVRALDAKYGELDVWRARVDRLIAEGEQQSKDFGVADISRRQRQMLPKVLEAAVLQTEQTKSRLLRLEYIVGFCTVLNLVVGSVAIWWKH